jgi:curved DNA-binding protein CbpA
MTKHDALKILGLTGLIEAELVKNAYREAARKYHPDMGGSVEMMQVVNEAYDTLRDIKSETIDVQADDYPEKLNDALNAIIGLDGIIIEICGSWVWVSGNTKEFKKLLNNAGYKWASKKFQWYFRPADFKSRGRGKFSMDEIRIKYGSRTVEKESRRKIA